MTTLIEHKKPINSTHRLYGKKDNLIQIITVLKKEISKLCDSCTYSKDLNALKIAVDNRQGLITFKIIPQTKNCQHFQRGLDCLEIISTGINLTIEEKLNNLGYEFSIDERKVLSEYTPVLESLINSEKRGKPLSNFIVIFREHSLISVYNIFKILKSLGLKPENSVYYSKGDKCRNIERIEATFKKDGITVFTLSPFESVSGTKKTNDEKITPQGRAKVFSELSPFFIKAKERGLNVIVVDDGGLLVTTVIDLFHKEYSEQIYGYVETTKGGMNSISAIKDQLPTIINLADCKLKNLLNNVIGHSIVNSIQDLLSHVGLRGQAVLVVGYGMLGKAVAQDLRNLGMQVHVCELNSCHAFEAVSDGFYVTKDIKGVIKTIKPLLIVGCTGMDALTFDNLSLIEHDTYVATVSSNEIKMAYPELDNNFKLTFIENYARIYTLPSKSKLIILGNGASLNLFNGEGANHSEYQPFLALIIESIIYIAQNGPLNTTWGLDTKLADDIELNNNILGRYMELAGILE